MTVDVTGRQGHVVDFGLGSSRLLQLKETGRVTTWVPEPMRCVDCFEVKILRLRS